MRKIVAAMVAIFALAGMCPAYCESPTKIVVGFAAGGTSSSIARCLAESLERMSRSSFVVENRSGAGGFVAAEHVKRQKADGRTLLLMSSSSSLMIPPSPGLTYVALVATYKYVLVTAKQNPRSMAEYFSAARQNDVLHNVATPGTGTTSHIIAASMFEGEGVPMIHIPFSGAGPAMQSVLSGHVASALVPYPDITSYVDMVQLLAETGSGIDQGGWIGILAPTSVPLEELLRLQQLFRVASEQSRDRLERLGFTQAWRPGSELREIHEREYNRYSPVLGRLGVSIPKL